VVDHVHVVCRVEGPVDAVDRAREGGVGDGEGCFPDLDMHEIS
jgi:hypothetical protein